MRLSRVHIQNYRSIVDSSIVEIEPSVTVIIGKNEQGKTNFLKAIRAFNTDQQFNPEDLPNHLRPTLEQQEAGEIPIVTLWFSLEPQDYQNLNGIIAGIETASELKCVKHYGNNYAFWVVNLEGEQPLRYPPPDLSNAVGKITITAKELQNRLMAHAQRLPTFAVNSDMIQSLITSFLESNFSNPAEVENVIRSLITSVNALPGQDQPIIDDITTASTDFEKVKDVILAEFQKDPAQMIKQYLPRFVLHSTKTDHIPNDVNIADFIKDPDATSKGMANLCRVANLSTQKVRELAAAKNAHQREAYEDYYKGTISGGLNEFWTQTVYQVHFRIDNDRLSVSISDDMYDKRIPPSDRSEGFQWYLSFYATLLNDTGSSRKSILLIDNPGLELHLDGQRDIKRFLEEKVSLTSQVIYVTHSPAMIDPFNLNQVRTVELLPSQNGTKINRFVLVGGPNSDLLEPVRAAIGMSLISSLVHNEWNVLVEGSADKPIVEGIFVRHYSEYKQKVLVNGSLSESKDAALVLFYHRTGLPYIALLDADSGGRALYSKLVAAGIPKDRIVRLEEVFPDKEKEGDFALEDILSPEFYHKAVISAYPNNLVDQPSNSTKKRANLYEESFKAIHKIGFNKKRVADAVKKLLKENQEDENTKNALGTLSGAIIEKLKAQVSETEMVPIEHD